MCEVIESVWIKLITALKKLVKEMNQCPYEPTSNQQGNTKNFTVWAGKILLNIFTVIFNVTNQIVLHAVLTGLNIGLNNQ
jgi:uncharacterized integral membrane protein